MSKPKVQQYAPPAAAPAPINTEIAKRSIGGDDDEFTKEKRKRKGRKSLRIDPQTGGMGASGRSGINIPMK